MDTSRQEQPKSVVVRVPMTFRRYGGRKQIVLPDDAGASASPPEVDKTLLKAHARAFRWRKLLEDGVYTGINEIATAERISPSYVSRLLRLTSLALDIVEAILDGRQGRDVTLDRLRKSFPIDWAKQLSGL